MSESYTRTPVILRLMRRTVEEDRGYLTPCRIWQGSLTRGYGKIGRNGSVAYTHRVAYEYFVGPIPEGFQIDHLCRVPTCCEPSHLEAVTQLENIRRAQVKTHCLKGHPYSGHNLYVKPDGRRECRACRSLQRKGIKTMDFRTNNGGRS